MHALSNIFFILAGILAAAVIISSIRKALAYRARMRRTISRAWDEPAGPTSSNPRYSIVPHLTEVTSDDEALAYRTRRMGEIIRTAGCSTDRADLIGAGIRLGCTNEVAGIYADMILNDPGEKLPGAMLNRPNLGSDDLPYAGPNLVDAHEIADEMKGIVQYHVPGRGE